MKNVWRTCRVPTQHNYNADQTGISWRPDVLAGRLIACPTDGRPSGTISLFQSMASQVVAMAVCSCGCSCSCSCGRLSWLACSTWCQQATVSQPASQPLKLSAGVCGLSLSDSSLPVPSLLARLRLALGFQFGVLGSPHQSERTTAAVAAMRRQVATSTCARFQVQVKLDLQIIILIARSAPLILRLLAGGRAQWIRRSPPYRLIGFLRRFLREMSEAARR